MLKRTMAMRAIEATLTPTTDHSHLTSIRKKLGSFASAFESHTIKNALFTTTPFQIHVVEDVPADWF